MKFTTATIAILLSLTTTISAAPTPNLNARNITSPNYIDTSSAITPHGISIYHGYNGAIQYGVTSGKIQRIQSGNDDISTLVTFYFPSGLEKFTCEFMFQTDDADSKINGDIFDVFNSNEIVKSASKGWGAPSNYRGTPLGRMKAIPGGNAKVMEGFPGKNTQFKCPSAGFKGYEVAPTGDKTHIEWHGSYDGPYIRYW
ncbi:hypothetical protein K469DRAFT_560699 [Zopfia rhizophila CBS 207.26]|uniref:Ubiquitin 3 binding protein But2 C-terminal domain-containing protein n=1 Tax=Zopfia rhizophila CBS 207.26 TaxID=1314779 RepID=A0A6A6EJE9_9PEZI|nr:hypothetical protein K469DRAFT_560699 [Zopfia rhizophila CBS 207.26]